jgi:pyruvate dehydrogenase E2 component (dihydrolipoamide acetyltransferase)
MPALGMSQEVGTVVSWFKREGDKVVRGEPLLEVETDKAVVAIEAPASGTLAGVLASEGDQVPVGQVIAQILVPGEEAAANTSPSTQLPPALPAKASAPAGAETLRRGERADGSGLQASPKARRLAAELGIPLDKLPPKEPGEAIRAKDVLAAAAGAPPPNPSTAPTAPTTGSSKTSRLWRTMATRTTQSWQAAPHFYLVREVDASQMIAWRKDLQSQGLQVTYTDLLVSVTAISLVAHPQVNSRWEDGLVAQPDINVALAVAVDDGLVVPVIKAADQLTLSEIAARRRALIDRARGKRLAPADVSGGTFSISNLGMFGIDAFSAILNAGQGAILAVGRISDRVVAVDGRPEVRPMMVLTLSCDHRVIDGARGAEFLQVVATLLETPGHVA